MLYDDILPHIFYSLYIFQCKFLNITYLFQTFTFYFQFLFQNIHSLTVTLESNECIIPRYFYCVYFECISKNSHFTI